LDRNKVLESLVNAIHGIQSMSNRALSEVKLDDVPIDKYDGFDSLSGLEATIVLAGELGIDDDGKENFFITRDGRRAMTVSEIVDRVHSLIQE
jgi:hypothetical protein